MSTICCLAGPTNPSLLEKTVNPPEYTQTAVIFNENLPLSMTNPQHIPQSSRSTQNLTNRLVLVNEENEVSPIGRLNDHEQLILPCSTRALKRRPSLLEKSRDWARRLMALHRNRRNTISNEKFRSSCYDFHQNSTVQKNSHHQSLHQNLQSFDEDGYLSPMDIKIKLDHLAQEKAIHLPSSLSNKSQQQLLVYSHSSSDISQPIYRCHGPIRCLSTSKYFHRSLSAVDYIDDDEVTEESLKRCNDSDDPLLSLRYLFNEDDNQEKAKFQPGSISRRTPRRSTNTSSISTDSGYCDIPQMTSSKLIPVHLISCTLIPVNVSRTDPMDMHCLPCTCPPPSMPLYTNNPADYDERARQRRKSSTNSSRTHLHRIVSRPQVEFIDHSCSCNQKYYSTMTICPNLSLSSANTSKSMTNTDDHPKQAEKKHFRKKRTHTPRLSYDRFPIVTDDLVAVSRWYKPHLDRDIICQALQQAEYGAFALRDSTTHQDCYALSVKVPKFTHDSNIAHYLIEKLSRHHTYHYRIKGTFKEFPTLLSLLTHHSVMPEILPITLNLQQTLAI